MNVISRTNTVTVPCIVHLNLSRDLSNEIRLENISTLEAEKHIERQTIKQHKETAYVVNK